MRGASLPRSNVEHARLEDRFLSAWSKSDELFRLVRDEDLLAQPIVWRHPFIFYVGHLPAFTWNQICGGILNWTSIDPYLDDLFCRGIDPDIDTGECHWHPEVPDRWPDLMQVLEYRDRVREAVLESLQVVPRIYSNDIMARDGRVFEMVLEHEYMHQETLLYMMQELPMEKKNRPGHGVLYSFQAAAPSRPIRIPAGTARIGARFTELHFGWDNEFSRVIAEVPGFTIDSMPVTNGAFFEFVESGAYRERRYWRRREDWDWKKRTQREHPNCWLKQGQAWFYKAMFDILPLAQVASWPVYVTLAEARAYASWRGMRLPTEAEFHRAAFGGPDRNETRHPWGEVSAAVRHGNFNFATWSPTPVGSYPAGASRWGVGELVGNGWEWTESPFWPFPGFSPYTSYPDYSADFFDGKHFVVKGASWATASELLRPSFRNWYQVHYPHVFAKFRCVSDSGANEA